MKRILCTTAAMLVSAVLSTMAAAQTTTAPDTTTPPPPPATTRPPDTTTPPDTTAPEAGAPKISTQYLGRTQSRYGTLTESSDDMKSLVTGLRTGGEITLGGETFTAPTKPMGYGNITRTLDLAQKQLAAQGITQPTSAEFRSSLDQILQMRADGMGWGRIAQSIGVHPGMGKAPVTTTAIPASSAGGTQRSVTTAGGGKGIVTAAGGRINTVGARGHGNGNAHGRGVATSASASTAAGGGAVSAIGKGHASPNGKAVGLNK